MVKFWWMFIFFAKTASASSDNKVTDTAGKESRFLPFFQPKRYDDRPLPPIGPGGLPPLTQVPIAGERCSARLETALDQLKRKKRTHAKNLDSPMTQTLDLQDYSLHKQMRSAPVDMYVTRMRVRLPQNSNWVRVQKCYFDPRNVSLDTMLLFHDLTISGNVDLYDANELDRGLPNHRLRRNYYERYPQEPYQRRGNSGCNMILRLRKAGIGFHTQPLTQQPGKFNVKTDSEFVEPGFISVYAYGCERYINRNAIRNKNNLPFKRRKRSDDQKNLPLERSKNSDEKNKFSLEQSKKSDDKNIFPMERSKRSDDKDNPPLDRSKRSDLFSFDPHLDQSRDEILHGRSSDTWDTVYEPQSRLNYERSKLFHPDDDLDDVEDISREMEDIFTKGIRTLLTTYMKKELQPAIKDTLMRNMGYVISYG